MTRSANIRKAATWAVALSIAVLTVALAAPAHAGMIVPTTWVAPEQRITTNSTDQRWPEISGNLVAFEDYRNAHDVGDPNDPETLFDIRVLDLTTMKSRLLTPYHTADGPPVISGKHVVWNDYGYGSLKPGIYFYDLATGVRRRLPVSGGRELRISGSRVVYERSNRIYVFNLSTWRESRVSPDGSLAGAPDISGTRVVWQDFRDGNLEIYAKDLASGQVTRVTNDPAMQQLPRISGTKVVWDDERNGGLNKDIYCYDLATHVEKQITTDPATQWFPAISGDRIVWMDERSGDGTKTDIWMYDLKANVEARVTDNTWWQGNPSISGDRIVYEDHLREIGLSMDLYLARIVYPKISVKAPSAVDYGVPVSIVGTATSAYGIPLEGATVELESSSNGATWSLRDTTTTVAGGAYTLTFPGTTTRRYVRVRFRGNVEFAPALSASKLIRARLDFLAAPATKTDTMTAGVRYKVWGDFAPKHSAGSHQIKVRAYRYQKKSDGTYGYVHRFTYTMTVYNTGAGLPDGYSRYSGYVNLPYKGRWKLRAYHAEDSTNAATWSAAKYVVVK